MTREEKLKTTLENMRDNAYQLEKTYAKEGNYSRATQEHERRFSINEFLMMLENDKLLDDLYNIYK